MLEESHALGMKGFSKRVLELAKALRFSQTPANVTRNLNGKSVFLRIIGRGDAREMSFGGDPVSSKCCACRRSGRHRN
jgi:hypothetical protein